MNTHRDKLIAVNSFDFDCLAIAEQVGRADAFVMLVVEMFFNIENVVPATVELSNEKLIAFLKEIKQGYRESVTYHNDLHGADVA